MWKKQDVYRLQSNASRHQFQLVMGSCLSSEKRRHVKLFCGDMRHFRQKIVDYCQHLSSLELNFTIITESSTCTFWGRRSTFLLFFRDALFFYLPELQRTELERKKRDKMKCLFLLNKFRWFVLFNFAQNLYWIEISSIFKLNKCDYQFSLIGHTFFRFQTRTTLVYPFFVFPPSSSSPSIPEFFRNILLGYLSFTSDIAEAPATVLWSSWRAKFIAFSVILKQLQTVHSDTPGICITIIVVGRSSEIIQFLSFPLNLQERSCPSCTAAAISEFESVRILM